MGVDVYEAGENVAAARMFKNKSLVVSGYVTAQGRNATFGDEQVALDVQAAGRVEKADTGEKQALDRKAAAG
jgi:hypothetical protein